jgi:hypothetical protein
VIAAKDVPYAKAKVVLLEVNRETKIDFKPDLPDEEWRIVLIRFLVQCEIGSENACSIVALTSVVIRMRIRHGQKLRAPGARVMKEGGQDHEYGHNADGSIGDSMPTSTCQLLVDLTIVLNSSRTMAEQAASQCSRRFESSRK